MAAKKYLKSGLCLNLHLRHNKRVADPPRLIEAVCGNFIWMCVFLFPFKIILIYLTCTCVNLFWFVALVLFISKHLLASPYFLATNTVYHVAVFLSFSLLAHCIFFKFLLFITILLFFFTFSPFSLHPGLCSSLLSLSLSLYLPFILFSLHDLFFHPPLACLSSTSTLLLQPSTFPLIFLSCFHLSLVLSYSSRATSLLRVLPFPSPRLLRASPSLYNMLLCSSLIVTHSPPSASCTSKAPVTLSGWSSAASTSTRTRTRWPSILQTWALSTRMNFWAVPRGLSSHLWQTGKASWWKTHVHRQYHNSRIQMQEIKKIRFSFWLFS